MSRDKSETPQVLMTREGTIMEKPKRLRSAYNLFFQHHRQQLLQTLPARAKKPRNSHGKIDFQSLARTVAHRWRNVSQEEKAYFQGLANEDRERYKREMKQWKELETAHRLGRFEPVLQQMEVTPEFVPSAWFESENDDLEPIPLYEHALQITAMAHSVPATFAASQMATPAPFMHTPIGCSNVVRNTRFHQVQEMQLLADRLGPGCIRALINAFKD